MSERKRITVVFSVLLAASLVGSMLMLRRVDALRTGATLEERSEERRVGKECRL